MPRHDGPNWPLSPGWAKGCSRSPQRPAAGRDVVHARVPKRDGPRPGDRVEDKALAIQRLQPCRDHQVIEFSGLKEPAPIMRASRKPPQYVLRTDDRQDETPRGPVDRRADHQPPRIQECGTRVDKGTRIRNMLDDFHRQDNIKTLAAFNHRIRSRTQIPDVESRLFGMCRRRTDACFRHIHTGHIGPQPGHGFTDQAPTAADVDEFQLPERPRFTSYAPEFGTNLIENVIQPAWIQHVKGTELAAGRPPLGRQGLELRNFLRIDGTNGTRHPCTFIQPRIRAFLHQGQLLPKTL